MSYQKLNFKKIWPEKLFLGVFLVQAEYFGLVLVIPLKFYIIVAKGLKLNARTFWELVPAFVAVTGEKLEGRLFTLDPK